MRQTSDGGFIVSGEIETHPEEPDPFYLFKTDSQGVIEWEKWIQKNDVAYEGYSVQETSDQGFIITGKAELINNRDEFYLLKTDKNGNLEWEKTMGVENSVDFIYSVEQTDNGGYILAGATFSYGAGLADAWILKTDTNGEIIWEKTIGGVRYDRCYSVKQTSDGGYILAGYSQPYAYSESDFWEDGWLVKTDANGNTMWEKTYGGDRNENFDHIEITSDGGFILTGYSESFGPGDSDVWLVKTDEQGNI